MYSGSLIYSVVEESVSEKELAPRLATLHEAQSYPSTKLPVATKDTNLEKMTIGSTGFLASNTLVSKELLSCVVKVFCVKTEPNYSMPWQMKRQTSSTGSGFVIAGKRIITNAHCVAYQSSVRVRKHGSAEKYTAKVLAVGHTCDLAILTVEEESFWKDIQTVLEFGGIPNLQEAVTTVGYPTGGDNISVTKGVVSRIEETYYSHGCSRLLAIQVDAAINAGNSGGPALMEGKVVGVCFETLTNAENIGYIIPVPIIEHFLMDIQRPASLTGFCDIGIQVQGMESEVLRRSMGMVSGQTGILINKMAPLAPTAQVVRIDDVLLEIDGIPVGNDGTIPFRDGERVSFKYELLKKFVGDKISLTLLRHRSIMKIDVDLATYQYLCPVQLHDIIPSYVIFAGFVFQVLSQPYLSNEWGKDWKKKAPIKMVDHHIYHLKEFKDQELVVISQILVNEVNVGYSACSPALVTSFNGEKILNLKHLARLIEDVKIKFAEKGPIETPVDEADGADEVQSQYPEFLRIDLEDGRLIILDTKTSLAISPQILKQQNIPDNMSADLKLSLAVRSS